MRTSSALLLLLAGCSQQAPAVAEGEEHIACALGGKAEFAPDCAVERVTGDGTSTLVVRHPDGGFRRFDVLKDGRGVAVADGADEAQVVLAGDTLQVTVGTDRYRFPATARGNAAAK